MYAFFVRIISQQAKVRAVEDIELLFGFLLFLVGLLVLLLCVCMGLCTCVVPKDARRRHWLPRRWNYRQWYKVPNGAMNHSHGILAQHMTHSDPCYL